MNKKTFFIIVVFTLLSKLTSTAQEIRYGIVAGVDVAKPIVTSPKNLPTSDVYDPMLSFNINGHMEIKYSDFWGATLEPGFIQKGGKIKGEDLRVNLNCLQLPVFADLHLTKKFFVSVGPEFSYLISAKVKAKNMSADATDIYDYRVEISGLIGLNYILSDKFDVGVRYNHGITKTSKTEYTDNNGIPVGEAKEYNQYFQVLLRYKF